MSCCHWINRGLFLPIAMLLVVVAPLATGTARAQDAAPAGAEPKQKLPAPEAITLTTKDGLQLKATFYAGSKGKKTVPVIILHDFKSNRNPFTAMAEGLQKRGYAVLVPDLRGHGTSTRFVDVTGMDIEAAKMRRNDFGHIIEFDMEALRKFLVTKNDEGELNLNSLCIVGSEMGTVMAVNWTAHDWSLPPLATGKQGQDVKSLVLVSPEWSFKGVPIGKALATPVFRSNRISLLILVGEQNTKAMKNATRLHNTLVRWHPEPDDFDAYEKRTLWLEPLQTSLQGVKLLDAGGADLLAFVADFLQWRTVDLDFEWTQRRTIK